MTDIFKKANEIIGELTPLRGHDCGTVCDCACCKGDELTGMRLFPGEQSELNVVENENGRFVLCGGRCDREKRPLACRIFPFYPCVDARGKVSALIDGRGGTVCPLVRCCDDVKFDRRFIRAVERVGRLLMTDEECAEELRAVTDEIVAVNEMIF